MTKRKIDIRTLKEFASRLPRDSALREFLLTEEDELETNDLLSKMGVWLRLAEMRISLRVSV